MATRLLLVDDDNMILQLFSLDAEQSDRGFELVTARNGNEAISLIDQETPHAIVLDLRMKQGDGFSVLEHLKAKNHNVPVIVFTNYNVPEYREKCAKYGVTEYLIKSETRMGALMQKLADYAAA